MKPAAAVAPAPLDRFDLKAFIKEVATTRNFAARQSVVQIYGECENGRTGRKAPAIDGSTTESLLRTVMLLVIPEEHYRPGMGIAAAVVLLLAAGMAVRRVRRAAGPGTAVISVRHDTEA